MRIAASLCLLMALLVIAAREATAEDGPAVSAAKGVSAAPSRQRTEQVEFLEPTPLLDSNGALSAWGWARRANMQYNRDAIPAKRLARIKEWDHYTIMSPEFTVGFTIVQLGPLVMGSAELIDYKAQSSKHALFMIAGKKDQAVLPPDPYGQTRVAKGDDFLSMAFGEYERSIEFHFAKSPLAVPFAGKIVLADDRQTESVAITRPFAGEGEFFYENKIFGMPASGSVTVDGQEFTLPDGNAWAIFDWGRGIWPNESSWFWGQAAGKVEGKQVAINLGHGYGDDSRGTCNAILVDGKLHKLDIVDCQFDKADRKQPWQFSSNDNRLALAFRPIYQQHSKTDVGFARTELFKIHGYYTGTLVLDDGTILKVTDLLGFAEHMEQRW
jgi:hypothetical protein